MRWLYICIISISLLLSQGVFAKKNNGHKPLGKKHAASLVQKKYPGKVLKIKDFKQHYKVRILQPKGRVLDLTINKKSGKIKKGHN